VVQVQNVLLVPAQHDVGVDLEARGERPAPPLPRHFAQRGAWLEGMSRMDGMIGMGLVQPGPLHA